MQWMTGGAIAAAVPVLVACGGGGDGVDGGELPPPPGGDGPLDARRFAAIFAVEAQCRRLSATQPTALGFAQAMAAHMASDPAYIDAGFSEESLSAWGTFADGRAHIVTRNYVPTKTTAAAVAEPTIAALAKELPAAAKARLLHTFGAGFDGQQVVTDISCWLRTAGYQPANGSEGDGSLSVLRAVKGDGFFYINTHGGTGRQVKSPIFDAQVYSIQSSTLASLSLERTPEMQDDIANGRLTYMTCANGETGSILGVEYADFDTRYGITADFVAKHWSFSADSVVIVNACVSALGTLREGALFAAPFYNACLTAGAGVYLGWTNNVTSEGAFRVPRYFTDRLLGANEYQAEKPPQRGFGVDDVVEEMARKNLLKDAAGPAVFRAVRNGEAPLLVPAIHHMVVDEFRDELVLQGAFGSRDAVPANACKVIVDGVEPEVISWTAEKVVCRLARDGAGSAGEVRVAVGPHRSNMRRISRWTLKLDYRWQDPDRPGLTVTGKGTVHHRADVGRVRDRIGDAPKRPTRYAVATRDSLLPLRAAGSHQEGSDCTYAWTGAADYLGTFPGDGGRVLFADLKIDTERMSGALGLGLGGFSSGFTQSGCARPQAEFAVAFGQLEDEVEFIRYNAGAEVKLPSYALHVFFTENLTLKGDSFEKDQVRLSWTDAAAEFPPLAHDAA